MNDYVELHALYHHGIKGQKWGIRRFQNEDGTLTKVGKERYDSTNYKDDSKINNLSKVSEECNKTEVLKKAKCQIKVDKKGITNDENIFWKVFSNDGKPLKFGDSYTLWSQEVGDLLWERLGRPGKEDKIYNELIRIQDKLLTAEYEFKGELEHHGIKGQKWGVRRYQNEDGSFTKDGMKRYGVDKNGKMSSLGKENFKIDQTSIKGQRLYEKGKSIPDIRSNQIEANIVLGYTALSTLTAAFSGTSSTRVIDKGEFQARSTLAAIGSLSVAALIAANAKANSDAKKLKIYYANGSKQQYREIKKKK